MEEGLDAKYVDGVVQSALKNIRGSVFGKKLLDSFPAITVSRTYHAREWQVLQRFGSPACTDGKNIFICNETMGAILAKKYHDWDLSAVKRSSDRDRYWEGLQLDPREHKIDSSEIVGECRDIIYHELTHAMNQHCKLQRKAEKFSEDYQQKLAIACELQANDGIAGHEYYANYTQQNEGVTNKYKHRECIGYHTLRDFLAHIKLTPEEQAQAAMKQLIKDAKARREMANATGAMEQIDREIEEEEREEEQEKREKGGTYAGIKNDDTLAKSSDEKLSAELKAEGLRNIKKLILATLSDELKYDAATDSVIYNKVRKRVLQRTYSRPSRRGDIELSAGCTIMRKGIKTLREVEYNKTHDLTVLAVDASGSMGEQEKFVSAILDKLLRQVEEVAKEEGLKINYDNMRGMLHTERASDLMVINSREWKDTMARYRAEGGNDFDCVMRAVEREVKKSAKPYETINIINLSDAMGYLDADFSDTALGTYIARKRIHWIDAIILEPHYERDIEECCRHDHHAIRTQEVIAIAGEDF